VLKQVDDAEEATGSAKLLIGIEPRGFRLARPLRAADGRWVVDGWAATEWIAGVARPAGPEEQLLAAGRAFHAALASVPRPAWLDARTHRWARADRVAWGEQPGVVPPVASDQWSRLTNLLGPVRAPSQLIHGDLNGNVLFADNMPPAIIDFSPYWRPVAYAEAIVVIDRMLWFGAGPELMRRSRPDAGFAQLLVRALIFRLIALTEHARDVGSVDLAELQLFSPVVAAVEQRVAGR
jgi:uncharacterized protein (TIGR02569 family)